MAAASGPSGLKELDAHPDAWQPILDAAQNGSTTLLYSSRDAEHNNAMALKQYLERNLDGEGSRMAAKMIP